MKKSLSVAIAGLMSLSLAGCDDYTRLKADPHVQKAEEVSQKKMLNAKGLENQITNDPLQVSQSTWTGATAVRMRRGQPLPKSIENDRGVTLIAATPLSLAALGAQVAATSGIPVRLADDATLPAGTAAVAAAGTTTGPSELNSPMTIAYEGPLSALLDQIGSHFNLSWRYDGSTITFFRYETRTFVMESMPGTQSVTDGLKNSTSSGGSSGGSSSGSGGGSSSSDDVTQESELKIDLKFWDDLKGTVESILGGEGRFTTAPSSGTVTVTTTPDRMRSISTFVEKENTRLGRQVAINVDVYTVTINDSDDYGMKLSGAFDALTNGSGGFTGITPPGVNTATGTIAFAFGGSDINANGVLSALSTIGKTAVVSRMPVTTLNNRPASRKITVDQAYLASITTTLGTLGTSPQTALTPGTISSGITLQLLPRLLADGRIMLQYSLKITELRSLKSFSAQGTDATSTTGDRIQLPEVANKIFVQQAMLTNGSTLVLAGFDQDDQRGESRGIGSASNWLFGGGFTNSKDRQYLVIAITPREVSTGASTGL